MAHATFNCGMCDKPEGQCSCSRYCSLCQNPETVRLVSDGAWYCRECREACDYKTEDETRR